jgi:hypothetical protein
VPDPEPCPDPCPVVLIKVKVHPCLDLNFAGSRQKNRPLVKTSLMQSWPFSKKIQKTLLALIFILEAGSQFYGGQVCILKNIFEKGIYGDETTFEP